MAAAPITVQVVGAPLARQQLGAVLLLDGYFTDPATGAFIDPLAVAFKYRIGRTGAITPVTPVTKLGVGRYRAGLTLSAAGVWYLRWETNGTDYIGDDESQVVVKPSAFS